MGRGQHLSHAKHCTVGFPGGSVVKNPPVSAEDAGDLGSILGSENPLTEEMATHAINLAWEVPGTEEPVGLSQRGHKESDMTEQQSTQHAKPRIKFSKVSHKI